MRLTVDLDHHLIKAPASMPKTAHPAYTLPSDLSDRGKRTYIITTRRITSGDELKRRKGLAGLRFLGMPAP